MTVFDEVHLALSKIPIKTPQLIGIILGCVVFTITICGVIYVLVREGTLQGALRELAGKGKSTTQTITGGGVRAESKSPIISTRPTLYDSLIESARVLPLRPNIPVMILRGVRIQPLDAGTGSGVVNSDKEMLLNELYRASNGTAQYHESAYDAHARVWGLLDLSPSSVMYTQQPGQEQEGEEDSKDCVKNKSDGESEEHTDAGIDTDTTTSEGGATRYRKVDNCNKVVGNCSSGASNPSLHWCTARWPFESYNSFRNWFVTPSADAVHLCICDEELGITSIGTGIGTGTGTGVEVGVGKPIGMVSLVCNRPYDLSIRISNLWLTPAYRISSSAANMGIGLGIGSGMGTSTRPQHAQTAIFLILTWLFEQGYRRVSMEVDALNIPAKKFVEHCGFMQEGIIRKAHVVNCANQDICLYAMLNSDWPVVEFAWRGRLGMSKNKDKDA